MTDATREAVARPERTRMSIETDCECEGVGCDDCYLGGDWWDE